MARRRIGPVVRSYKNVIDTSGGLTAGVVSTTAIAVTVTSNNLVETSNNIPVGGKVGAVYYSIYIFSNSTESTSPVVDLFFWKQQVGVLSAPVPGQTGSDPNKRFVFHEAKGLAGNRTQGMPMHIEGVFRVPRVYSRFGLDDQLQMKLQNPVAGFFCAKFIYKVFH